MHRYRPDTVSVVLNDYLREFRAKLTARLAPPRQVSISGAVSPRSDKAAALKEIDRLTKAAERAERVRARRALSAGHPPGGD